MTRYVVLLSLMLLALCSAPAQAQDWRTVATCGAITFPTRLPGTVPYLTADQTGVLCTSATGGGGGGGASVTATDTNPTYTEGSTSNNISSDLAGNIRVRLGITASTLTAWTSATALNATQTLMSVGGAPALIVQLDQTTTITAGAATFEGTFDGTNWVTLPVAQVLNANTFAPLANPYTLVASTNQPFLILPQGYQSIRVKLSTQITGTGSVTPFVALLNHNPVIGALLNTGAVTAPAGAALALDATLLAEQAPVAAAAATATKAFLSGCQYLAALPTFTNTQQGSCIFDVNGRLLASLASAAPIAPATATATKSNLVGFQYNSTQSTFTDGQQGGLQGSPRGALYVNPGAEAFTVALPAAETHIGEIASNQIKVQVAQTVTASSAYTSGNAIGGLMTIAGAARVSGSLGAAGTGGIVTGMVMNSKSLQTTQVDVVFFDANPTGSTCTDKTAFSLATADFDKVVGYMTIPGTAANGAGWVPGAVGSLGIPTYYPVTYDLSSATSLYACAVTRGTPTYTATSDVAFKFNMLRN